MLEALAAQFDKDVAEGVPTAITVRCGFEAEFACRTSRKEMAAQLEAALGLRMGSFKVSNQYGASHDSNYTQWAIEDDTSIPTNSTYRIACEVISPIMDLEPMLSSMETVFNTIKHYGKTSQSQDGSTGLHITFSLKDINLKSVKFDPLKLLLLLGEHYWGQVFGRESAGYASQILSSIQSNLAAQLSESGAQLTYADALNFVQQSAESGIDSLKYDALSTSGIIARAMMSSDRRRSINLAHLYDVGKSRVEFRLPGGENYEHKFDKMSAVARRFAYALWASCHELSDKYNDVYARKLWRIMRSAQDTADKNPNPAKQRAVISFSKEPSGTTRGGSVTYSISRKFISKTASGVSTDLFATVTYDKKHRPTDFFTASRDDANTLIDLADKGTLMGPFGEPLSLADIAVGVDTVSRDVSLTDAFRDLFNEENSPMLGDAMAMYASLDADLVRKYGQDGAVTSAMILASSMTPLIFDRLRNAGMAQINPNRVRAVAQVLPDYVKYVRKYKNLLAKVSDPDLIIGTFVSNAPAAGYKRILAHFNESIPIRVPRAPNRYSTASTAQYIPILGLVQVHAARGRNDLATIGAMHMMDPSRSTGSTVCSIIADWSFLDPAYLKDDISASFGQADLYAQLVAMRGTPHGFIAQYVQKAPAKLVKPLLKRAAESAMHAKLDFNNAASDWYAVTGFPAIDNLIKQNYQSGLDAAAALRAHDTKRKFVLFPRIAGEIDSAHTYDAIKSATAEDVEECIVNPATLATTAYVLMRINSTAAILPDNKNIADAIKSSPSWRSALNASLLFVDGGLKKPMFGLQPTEIVELLCTGASIYTEFSKPMLRTLERTFSTYLTNALSAFVSSLTKSGIPADVVFGPQVLAWYQAMHKAKICDAVIGSAFTDLLKFGGLLDDRGHVAHSIRSPLIAQLFLDQPVILANDTSLAAVLPDGYLEEYKQSTAKRPRASRPAAG